MGFFVQGAHRGGTSFVEQVQAEPLYRCGRRLVLADPHPGRVDFLARRVRERFPGLEATPVTRTGVEALSLAGAEDPLLLVSDSVDSLLQTLRARQASQPALWQIVGRGPGGSAGTRLGLRGTVLPGDEAGAADSALLLDALSRLAPPASSRALTGGDALTASLLAPLRQRVLARTLRHLEELERDPADLTGGPLSLAQGREALPLKPLRGESGMRFRQMKGLVLEAAGQVPQGQWLDRGTLGRCLMVAVVIDEAAVHLFTTAQSRRGRRRVEGLHTLEAPVPQAPPAVFTD